VNEISTAIASAVEARGAANREISRNVEEASTGTAEVSSNIVGVAQASQQISAGSSQVLSAASELTMIGERLKRKSTHPACGPGDPVSRRATLCRRGKTKTPARSLAAGVSSWWTQAGSNR
jgi:hypothetical protein